MAANDQKIYLGWKNRIVVYNIDGIKCDETRLQSIERYGELCDLTWSSTIQCLFILCRKSLFVHYPSSNQVKTVTVMNQDNYYKAITTCKTKLFILNNKTIDVWQSHNGTFLLEDSILISWIVESQLDDNICCVRTDEQNLCVLIQNTRAHSWRFDIFSLYPFRRVQTGIPFDNFNQPDLGFFMPLHNNIYLFMNWETKLMRIVNSNGSNEIIDYNAYNACLLGNQNKLVVNYMTYLKVYEFWRVAT